VCPVFNQNCARGSQSLGITLANLVSHTSGLANVMEQGNASVAAWLTDLQKSWLLFKPASPSNPGNLSAYSGVGIEAVGLIEQRISHKPYVDFVTQNLFLPLGMKHSSMDQTKLPGSLQAQKWMFSVSEKDSCKAGCMAEEQQCMQDAHSGPERGVCAKAQLNCTGKCPPPKSSYSFAQFDGMIGGDDQPMIAPAGGLATSVEDLALFMKMWLSTTAPTVNGHPLLKKKTIQDAATPLFTTVGSVPASCANPPNPITDSNNFAYSNCGLAQKFRVNWAVDQPPNIEHNGDEPGLSGSNTRLDQSNKMGATGLISTEPYPQPPQGSNIPQPAGLDPVFIDSVVYGTLNAGEDADKANPDWAGQVLADGVARVLYLSGKVPQAGDLAAFSASFIAANKLTAANVAGFLTTLHNQIGPCRTFRVRDANSPTSVELRLSCQKSEWDMILSVETAVPHRISWQTVSPKPPSPPSKAQCQAACNIAEGPCMSQAHSSADRQACIAEKKTCLAECNKK
jgi:CubicO group peptidase (beta-lactamase class C family)